MWKVRIRLIPKLRTVVQGQKVKEAPLRHKETNITTQKSVSVTSQMLIQMYLDCHLM